MLSHIKRNFQEIKGLITPDDVSGVISVSTDNNRKACEIVDKLLKHEAEKVYQEVKIDCSSCNLVLNGELIVDHDSDGNFGINFCPVCGMELNHEVDSIVEVTLHVSVTHKKNDDPEDLVGDFDFDATSQRNMNIDISDIDIQDTKLISTGN